MVYKYINIFLCQDRSSENVETLDNCELPGTYLYDRFKLFNYKHTIAKKKIHPFVISKFYKVYNCCSVPQRHFLSVTTKTTRSLCQHPRLSFMHIDVGSNSFSTPFSYAALSSQS